MLLLALDTCDSRGSLALLRDESVIQLEVHETSEDYSSWLLPAVQRVLRDSQVSLPELSAYAVAAGPGSFTGVRVGLTTVKAWSEVYGQPIAAVSRLEALGTYACSKTPFLAAFVDAQRSQVFAGLYHRKEEALERVGDEAVISAGQFLDWVASQIGAQDRVEWISPDPQCLASTPQWGSRIERAETIRVVAPVLAAAIGRVGARLVRENRLTDALSLDANYVRRSDAEIFWKGASSGK